MRTCAAYAIDFEARSDGARPPQAARPARRRPKATEVRIRTLRAKTFSFGGLAASTANIRAGWTSRARPPRPGRPTSGPATRPARDGACSSATKLTAASAVKSAEDERIRASRGSSALNCGCSPARTRNTTSVAPRAKVVAAAEPSTMPVRIASGCMYYVQRRRPLIGAGGVSSLGPKGTRSRGWKCISQVEWIRNRSATLAAFGSSAGHRLVLGAGTLLLGTAPAPSSTPGATTLELKPTERHGKVARLVGSMFERSHYRQAPVNDPVSSLVLDRYLESLDGARSYFLASDIAEFERYRYQLDDAVSTGTRRACVRDLQPFPGAQPRADPARARRCSTSSPISRSTRLSSSTGRTRPGPRAARSSTSCGASA